MAFLEYWEDFLEGKIYTLESQLPAYQRSIFTHLFYFMSGIYRRKAEFEMR
jgi:hypothetical protein